MSHMKKNLYKTALVAAFGLAGAAAAQAQVNPNDLVLGFTSQYSGVTDDYLVDLGQFPTGGAINVSLNTSGFNWSTFNSIFSGAMANNALNVGIVAGQNGNSGDVIFSVLDNGTGTYYSAGSSTPVGDTRSNLKNGAGIPLSLSLGEVAQGSTGSPTTSFYSDVAENPTTPGAANNNFTGYVDNPLSTMGTYTVLDLYEDAYTGGSSGSWVFDGTVTIGLNNDTLTAIYDTPEPGTGLIAGISGLSILILRRRFTKNA